MKKKRGSPEPKNEPAAKVLITSEAISVARFACHHAVNLHSVEDVKQAIKEAGWAGVTITEELLRMARQYYQESHDKMRAGVAAYNARAEEINRKRAEARKPAQPAPPAQPESTPEPVKVERPAAKSPEKPVRKSNKGGGRMAPILGQPVTAIIRWCGLDGWDLEQTKKMLESYGVREMPDNSIAAQIGIGKRKARWIPELSKEQVKELKKRCI